MCWISQLGMWRSSNSNSTTFELRFFFDWFEIRRIFYALCCRMRIRGKILVPRLISYGMQCNTVCRERKLFPKFNLSHKVHKLMMCYTVLIWTVILLTLENNIVTLLFNWPEPVHNVPTDKIYASIRIHIRRILKVKIRIRRFRRLPASATALHHWGSSNLVKIIQEQSAVCDKHRFKIINQTDRK